MLMDSPSAVVNLFCPLEAIGHGQPENSGCPQQVNWDFRLFMAEKERRMK
jgi:hypothetical protein